MNSILQKESKGKGEHKRDMQKAKETQKKKKTSDQRISCLNETIIGPSTLAGFAQCLECRLAE